MQVLVTGGTGHLGKFVVADLIENGYSVVNADRVLGERGEKIRPYIIDLLNLGQVVGVMEGCDAVVHLGAIPNPYWMADEFVFTNNTNSTFNVLQAARLLGVKKVVIASSVSAYGPSWSPVPLFPQYAPIDEEQPMQNHDPYGLSKEVDEVTARMFCRLTGMQIAAMRFHWVALAEEIEPQARELAQNPERGARNIWGYVEVRDAAAACRRGFEADFGGFEAFNIVAADTLSNEPTEALIAKHCPGTEIRSPMTGTTGGFVIEKARQLLDWQPQYRWRQTP